MRKSSARSFENHRLSFNSAIIASIIGLAYRAVLYEQRTGDTSWYDFDSTVCV